MAVPAAEEEVLRKGGERCFGYGSDQPLRHDPPALYNLEQDPSERFDVSKEHPEALAGIAREVERHRAGMVAGKPQLEERLR